MSSVNKGVITSVKNDKNDNKDEVNITALLNQLHDEYCKAKIDGHIEKAQIIKKMLDSLFGTLKHTY